MAKVTVRMEVSIAVDVAVGGDMTYAHLWSKAESKVHDRLTASFGKGVQFHGIKELTTELSSDERTKGVQK